MHVYSLLMASSSPLQLPVGVRAPLQIITQGQLAAVVEPDLMLESLQQDDAVLLQAVLVHDRVIRELFQQTTVLPLRFNAFPSVETLRLDLEQQQQIYLDQLQRLEGKAEVTLKLVSQASEVPELPPDLKGKEYFLAKKHHLLQQRHHQEQQQQEFDRLLSTIAERYPIILSADGQQVHILVERNTEAELSNFVEQLHVRNSLQGISFGDALPPFHFV